MSLPLTTIHHCGRWQPLFLPAKVSLLFSSLTRTCLPVYLKVKQVKIVLLVLRFVFFLVFVSLSFLLSFVRSVVLLSVSSLSDKFSTTLCLFALFVFCHSLLLLLPSLLLPASQCLSVCLCLGEVMITGFQRAPACE